MVYTFSSAKAGMAIGLVYVCIIVRSLNIKGLLTVLHSQSSIFRNRIFMIN